MSKKLKSKLMVLVMLLAVAMTQIPMLNVSAAEANKTFTVGNLKYEVVNNSKSSKDCNEVKVVGFAKGCSNKESVNIPSKITCNNKTYKVTQVANNAFCNNNKIKEVSIPKSVSCVGKNAFKGCSNLSDLNINCNKSAVKSGAFSKCSNITLKNCFK